MSKKTSSKANSENTLLDERIRANQVAYNRNVLIGVGLATAFLPAYLAHAVFSLSWTSLVNIPFFVIVPVVTGVMLSFGYGAMIESEFWKRQRKYDDGKGLDESLLRKLTLQVAVGYTFFFINLCFLIVSTLLQAYIFRNVDPRGSYFLASTLAAAFVWLLAQKNEESRQRRMRGQK